ncbi:HAD-IB family hydrolase [Corynebacterium sp. MSK044]|uniref:HAD family hydrolase n=1 Tax=Corynebacterium sp. MSK044 TaxID=3050195 RepID=UPI00254F7547|nr:HAD-IB family hydrolase [Corynebacterium sp. MSK044]MDK8798053.1 HAD-IB family hydrolase [Corynebacterium sp. MSK044]
MSPINGPRSQWSHSRGNVRRFIESTALPPIDDDHQRKAGLAAARAAVEAGGIRITTPDPDIPQHVTAAAFFDVDNTLIQGNSLIALGYQLFKRRYIKLGDIFPYLIAQVRYRVFGSELPDAMASGREKALSVVKGQSVEELTQLCTDIVENHLVDRTYHGTRELAAMHIAAGEQVWLVSATPVQVGQALAGRLEFTGALGTVAEEKDGKFTGRLVGDILHGPGKAHAVQALAEAQGLDLKECTAYSDSVNDIPMLSLVGTPVAINPDRQLRKHAEKNGWLIRDYRPVRRAFTEAFIPLLVVGGVVALMKGWKAARRKK